MNARDFLIHALTGGGLPEVGAGLVADVALSLHARELAETIRADAERCYDASAPPCSYEAYLAKNSAADLIDPEVEE